MHVRIILFLYSFVSRKSNAVCAFYIFWYGLHQRHSLNMARKRALPWPISSAPIYCFQLPPGRVTRRDADILRKLLELSPALDLILLSARDGRGDDWFSIDYFALGF